MRVAQAFAVMHPFSRYLRTVVFWQVCDWTLRLVVIWFFLRAFGIDQNVHNLLLVQATQSLAGLVPATPGGIGTEQAFILYAFRDAAITRSTLLAFSVGVRLTLTAVNVIVGFTALLLTLGTVRYKSAAAPPTDPGGNPAMTPAAARVHVRRTCLSLPETSERPSHGAPTFFVRGKTSFVTFHDNHHGDGRLAIWCAAEEGVQSMLVAAAPETYFVPPYVGVRGWLGVRLDGGVEDDELDGLIEDAYTAVAPRRLVEAAGLQQSAEHGEHADDE